MEFWSNINGKIFGHHEATPVPVESPRASQIQSSMATGLNTAAESIAAGSRSPVDEPSPGVAETAPIPNPAAPFTPETVDVTAILDNAVSESGQTLTWRTSIVDLLQAIDVDSSLQARKELAAELGYTGSTDDSASMNIWLHKAVIKRLSESGGKVPPELLTRDATAIG
jgi:hypothetical protein